MRIRLTANLTGFSAGARCLLAYTFLMGLTRGVFGVIYVLYLRDLGYQEDIIGFLNSSSALAAGIAAGFAGVVSDRYGRQRMLLYGSALEGICVLALTYLVTPITLTIFYVLIGVAFPIYMVSHNPALAENSRPEERTRLFSLIASIWLGTGMLGNVLGGALPALYGSLTATPSTSQAAYRFGLTAMLLLYVGAVLVIRGLGEQTPDSLAPGGRGFTTVIQRRTERPGRAEMIFIAQATLVSVVLALGSGAFFPFLPLYFREHLKADPALVGGILALGQALGLVGTLVAPLWARKVGPVWAVGSMQMFSGVLMLTVAWAPGLSWGMAAWCLRMASWNIGSPNHDSTQMAAAPPHLRALLNSWAGLPSGLGFNLAFAAMTALAGWLIVRFGYEPVFSLATPAYILGGILFVLVYGNAMRHRAQTTADGDLVRDA